MARAEYVKHVKGDKLKKGMVLVFQDYYEVLDRRTGDATRFEERSGETVVYGSKWAVTAYNRDGSGKRGMTRTYNNGVEYPTGRLMK